MPTHAEVIAKFKELHKKHHHPRGYLISTVPDDMLSRFSDVQWCETYNSNVSDRVDILTVNASVPLMGHTFTMQFDRPQVMEHRYEFESYFVSAGIPECAGFIDGKELMTHILDVMQLVTTAL